MNRRDFLQAAAVLLGTSAIAPSALSREQRAFIAAGPDFVERSINFFTPLQRALVSAVAETTIPATDTPGAIDAGVPHFIELTVAEWFTEAERQRFSAGLEDLAKRAETQHGEAFPNLSEAARIDLLETLESESGDADWYQQGKALDNRFDSDAPFICQVKELTAVGFFLSKVGATQVLRHNHFPGRFEGEIPLAEDDTSWALRDPAALI